MFNLKHKLPTHAYLWLGLSFPLPQPLSHQSSISPPFPLLFSWGLTCLGTLGFLLAHPYGHKWHGLLTSSNEAVWPHYRLYSAQLCWSLSCWRESHPELHRWPYDRPRPELLLCRERRLCMPGLSRPVRLWGASRGLKTPACLRQRSGHTPYFLPSLYPSPPTSLFPTPPHLSLPPPLRLNG